MPATAEDLGFEKTENGILQKLLKPPKPNMPLFKTRGKSRALAGKTYKVRGLTVVKRQTGKVKFVEKNVDIPQKRDGGYVNIEVHFDVNSSTIRPNSIKILEQLGGALARSELKKKSFFINGHTDSDGSAEYNLNLSLKRAISVRRYLTNTHSISSTRLKIMGLGEGVPLVENTSELNKQTNRRVEIVAIIN